MNYRRNTRDKLRTLACRCLTAAGIVSAVLSAASCAKMGQPDGGWFDEQPPRILGESPAIGSTDVNSKKITIYFDEFIKLDNPTENVVVSPPQLEAPEIKAGGKKITVELKDSLKPNTTYTVDFSNAISDNNEGNQLGNYTYSFSTGSEIDTMEIGGYVVSADNLEPISGILVGIYDNTADSAFEKLPLMRVSRTDNTGHFTIKGVRNGSYRVYALRDMDGNYLFNSQGEMAAFDPAVYTTTSRPDIRQDTIWRDSLHIGDISQTRYTHYYPDDVVLRAFTGEQTDRYFLKADRSKADHFSLYFSYGDTQLPVVRGLNFDEHDAFVMETSRNVDTLTYWLRDTTLVNQDTLHIELQYRTTDSTGVLVSQTDTLELLSRQPYARRMKERNEKIEKWQKQQERNRKRGRPVEDVMKGEELAVEYKLASNIDPDQNPVITFPSPLAAVDTAKIHLYMKQDTTWIAVPYEFGERPGVSRVYQIIGAWRTGQQYSLEIDSAAFTDIYGKASAAHKQGFRIPKDEEYNTFPVRVVGMEGKNIVLQLLNQSDKVVRETSTNNGTAVFNYVKPGTYYLRMFEDDNNNGLWDTGDYRQRRQPEAVYYYTEKVERKAKWDDAVTWNPKQTPLFKQKPSAIVKQRNTQRKQIKGKNLERARRLGVEYIPSI